MKKLTVSKLSDNMIVAIIGNLNIDLIIRNVQAMPLWGQEVFGDEYLLTSSGQSAYTALALRKFGMPVRIVSCVGNDIYGMKILDDLGTAGIDLTNVEIIKDGKTGITVAAVRPDGERSFISDPSSLDKLNRSMINRHLSGISSAGLAAVVGTFFLPGLEICDIGFFCEKFRNQGIPTLLDTGWDPENWPRKTITAVRNNLKYIDYFIPNIDEAYALTGEKSPQRAAAKLIADGCRNVIIKLGSEGSYCYNGSEEIRVSPFRTEVFDAVGAGDVFNAGLIFGLLQKWPVEAGMILGSSLSSIYISRKVDRFPSQRETLDLANTVGRYCFEESF